MTESQQLQQIPLLAHLHTMQGGELLRYHLTFVQTGGVPLPINNKPTMVCNSSGTTHTKPQLYDGSEDLKEYLAQFKLFMTLMGGTIKQNHYT